MPTTVSSELPDDPEILVRLAQTVLGTMYEAPPDFVAGRVPDGWPSSLVPPPPVSTLGGMSVGTALTAVFLYPPTADRPFADCCALFESNGWTRPQGVFGEGFESVRTAMFCRDSSLATVGRSTSDPADQSIVVSLGPCEGWPCLEDAGRPPRGTINVPRLTAPPGVRWDRGGGSSGGGDHIDSHIRVTTDLSPAELLPFYARQLADAGWRMGESSVNGMNATQWLEADDRRGHAWRGLLTVYVNGPAREVFIYMAAVLA